MDSHIYSLFSFISGEKGAERVTARENEEWVKLKVNSCTFAGFIALRKSNTSVQPTDVPYHS